MNTGKDSRFKAAFTLGVVIQCRGASFASYVLCTSSTKKPSNPTDTIAFLGCGGKKAPNDGSTGGQYDKIRSSDGHLFAFVSSLRRKALLVRHLIVLCSKRSLSLPLSWSMSMRLPRGFNALASYRSMSTNAHGNRPNPVPNPW